MHLTSAAVSEYYAQLPGRESNKDCRAEVLEVIDKKGFEPNVFMAVGPNESLK